MSVEYNAPDNIGTLSNMTINIWTIQINNLFPMNLSFILASAPACVKMIYHLLKKYPFPSSIYVN